MFVRHTGVALMPLLTHSSGIRATQVNSHSVCALNRKDEKKKMLSVADMLTDNGKR